MDLSYATMKLPLGFKICACVQEASTERRTVQHNNTFPDHIDTSGVLLPQALQAQPLPQQLRDSETRLSLCIAGPCAAFDNFSVGSVATETRHTPTHNKHDDNRHTRRQETILSSSAWYHRTIARVPQSGLQFMFDSEGFPCWRYVMRFRLDARSCTRLDHR